MGAWSLQYVRGGSLRRGETYQGGVIIKFFKSKFLCARVDRKPSAQRFCLKFILPPGDRSLEDRMKSIRGNLTQCDDYATVNGFPQLSERMKFKLEL